MIAGVTRVRNEEAILEKVLDHAGTLVDEVYAYDDCSTDGTPDILERHPLVKRWKKGVEWKPGPKAREYAEGNLRQIPYEMAISSGAEWVYYFDGDEIADFEGVTFDSNIDAWRLRLFDYYITPEDAVLPWYERKWMGPEYRDILMVWRVSPGIRFYQREPSGITGNVGQAGWVKHYGKAISVEQWEEACLYYSEERWPVVAQDLKDRWLARKGKAIHTESDFGRELILWEERRQRGILNQR